MRLNNRGNWRDKIKCSILYTLSRALSALPRHTRRDLMSPAHLAPKDEDAIELLVGKFTLRPNHARTLLELASGDQVLAESALLVAHEMGYDLFEGAHNYIVDILRLPAPKMSQQTT